MKRLRLAVFALLLGYFTIGCSGDGWKDHFRRTQYYTESSSRPTVDRLTKINTKYDAPTGLLSDGHIRFIDNGPDGFLDYVIIEHWFFSSRYRTDLIAIVDKIPPHVKFESPFFGIVRTLRSTYKREDGSEGGSTLREYMFERSDPKARQLQTDSERAKQDYERWKTEYGGWDWWFNRGVLRIGKMPGNVYEASLLGH